MDMPDLDTHYGLCQYTAEKFHKSDKADVTLWEYQSYATYEFPDVILFRDSRTTLYEIKMTKADFKNDAKKECRSKYKVTHWTRINRHSEQLQKLIFGDPRMKEFIQEAPHLGTHRFYVCPWGLIQPEEVGHWGLYWVKNGRFYRKKHSDVFRRNIYDEMSLLTHAMRKYAAGVHQNILIKPYSNS